MKRLLGSVTLAGVALFGSAFLVHGDAQQAVAALGGMFTGGFGIMFLTTWWGEKTGRI